MLFGDFFGGGGDPLCGVVREGNFKVEVGLRFV